MTVRLVALAVIFVLVAIGIFWIVRVSREFVLISIERQNNEAADAADQARSDYDVCINDHGGLYDFATGNCHRAAPRRRN